jgi:hypothetical protein
MIELASDGSNAVEWLRTMRAPARPSALNERGEAERAAMGGTIYLGGTYDMPTHLKLTKLAFKSVMSAKVLSQATRTKLLAAAIINTTPHAGLEK